MKQSEAILQLNRLIKTGPPSRIAFQRFVRAYFKRHGRSFPWRKTKSPYAILVSEVMLQQTQTERVVLKYREFLRKFPTLRALSRANKASVISVWMGLGYYRRALNLLSAAQTVCSDHKGRLPRSVEGLQKLPGVGAYTAAAVAAFAYNQPAPMIETNIRAVYLHVFFPGQRGVPDDLLLETIEETLDKKNPREWFYALMDLGAELKRHTTGINHRSRHHKKQSKFKGSLREVRAAILRLTTETQGAQSAELLERLPFNKAKVETAIASLVSEGFVTVTKNGRLRVAR